MPLRPWRRGTAAQRAANNVASGSGEMGVETDTGYLVVGDGTTTWKNLSRLARLVDITIASITDSGAIGRNVLAADTWTSALTALGISKPVVWCDYTDNARPNIPANAMLIIRGGTLAQAPAWAADDDWYLERTT